MRFRFLLLLVVLSAAGCGTIINLTEGTEPYVSKTGVSLDLQHSPTAVYGGVNNDLHWMSRPRHCPPLATVICLPDLLLSVVADTLTLPYTIPVSCLRMIREKDSPEESVPIYLE